jgi:hypothetical protein
MIYSPHCKAMVYTIEECDAILQKRIIEGDLRREVIDCEMMKLRIELIKLKRK